MAPLHNDGNINATALAGGIEVLCDHEVDAASVSRPTAFVTAEIPFTTAGQQPIGPTVAYQQLTLVGTVSAQGRVITWQPAPATGRILGQIAALRGQNERGVLCHLVLKGPFIWSVGPNSLYLDGSSYGVVSPFVAGTGLGYPTGDRRRGADFQTWFWLTPDDKEKEKEKEKRRKKRRIPRRPRKRTKTRTRKRTTTRSLISSATK